MSHMYKDFFFSFLYTSIQWSSTYEEHIHIYGEVIYVIMIILF